MSERDYKAVGQQVVYVDEHSKPHPALITIWWPGLMGIEGHMGCNLIYVSGDSAREDTYGRQMERDTSVVHKAHQPAGGKYWCWPDEV